MKNIQGTEEDLDLFNKNGFRVYEYLKGASDEQIARTWNGGYNGKNNPKTLGYWKKVRKQFKK